MALEALAELELALIRLGLAGGEAARTVDEARGERWDVDDKALGDADATSGARRDGNASSCKTRG